MISLLKTWWHARSLRSPRLDLRLGAVDSLSRVPGKAANVLLLSVLDDQDTCLLALHALRQRNVAVPAQRLYSLIRSRNTVVAREALGMLDHMNPAWRESPQATEAIGPCVDQFRLANDAETTEYFLAMALSIDSTQAIDRLATHLLDLEDIPYQTLIANLEPSAFSDTAAEQVIRESTRRITSMTGLSSRPVDLLRRFAAPHYRMFLLEIMDTGPVQLCSELADSAMQFGVDPTEMSERLVERLTDCSDDDYEAVHRVLDGLGAKSARGRRLLVEDAVRRWTTCTSPRLVKLTLSVVNENLEAELVDYVVDRLPLLKFDEVDWIAVQAALDRTDRDWRDRDSTGKLKRWLARQLAVHDFSQVGEVFIMLFPTHSWTRVIRAAMEWLEPNSARKLLRTAIGDFAEGLNSSRTDINRVAYLTALSNKFRCGQVNPLVFLVECKRRHYEIKRQGGDTHVRELLAYDILEIDNDTNEIMKNVCARDGEHLG